MNASTVNLLIGGEAGQGLVTIGQLLSKSLVRGGYRILVTQDYQSRIRGGHNTFRILAGPDEPLAPTENIDVLIALNQETVTLHQGHLKPGGLTIVDGEWGAAGDHTLSVPFGDLGTRETYNIVALGVAADLLGLDQGLIQKTLDDFFGHKHPEAAQGNRETLSRAYAWCKDRGIGDFHLPQPIENGPFIMMNGNEAIALGAFSAGLNFYSFYPMTPATSIALTLAAHAARMGAVVEQVEDEIAAINMAIGASFAGATSMVGTSGGGFALMTEGVSLAGMTETPLVVAISQRPGPATGLPTRTGQQDLEFVLHAGHGEFPRAVFAPGTVEECFHLTRAAFFVAAKSQSPVFLLTDQFLADSSRAIEPFDVSNVQAVEPEQQGADAVEPYLRYALTENGVSPRLIPGLTRNLVVADSDEHTEDGHLTEDLDAAVKMSQKRLGKIEIIRSEVVGPKLIGQKNPDVLLVCWGTSLGAVLETRLRLMEEKGVSASVLHFSQVWPLIPDQFLPHLTGAGQVIMVEGNATGQMARLIRRETGFHIQDLVLRYDGLPFTPEYILRHWPTEGGKNHG